MGGYTCAQFLIHDLHSVWWDHECDVIVDCHKRVLRSSGRLYLLGLKIESEEEWFK